MSPDEPDLLSLRHGVFHPLTRVLDTLLGPCFKTGQRGGRLGHWHPVNRAYTLADNNKTTS